MMMIRKEGKIGVVSPLSFLIPMSNPLLKLNTATQYDGKLCFLNKSDLGPNECILFR